MPFTLAHPAAILPLRGIPPLHGIMLVRTAPLIIGAMIPDTPYYLPASVLRTAAAVHRIPDTHTLEGTLTTCVLLGYLALAGLFALRQPLTFGNVVHAYTDVGVNRPPVAVYDEPATRHGYTLAFGFIEDAFAGKL